MTKGIITVNLNDKQCEKIMALMNLHFNSKNQICLHRDQLFDLLRHSFRAGHNCDVIHLVEKKK